MTEPRSSLGRHVSSGPKTDAEIRAEARRAYHESGVVLLREDWLGSWPDRTQLRLLAEKTFGKRRG